MAKSVLPTRIDPVEFVRNGQGLEGLLPLNAMVRLREASQQPALPGKVKVELKGQVDEQGFGRLMGHFRGELPLICARCSKPLQHSFDLSLRLGLLKSEAELAELPSDCEPLFITEEGVNLSDLVEDELLLALPIVPLHPSAECEVKESEWHFGQTPRPDEAKENPFAALGKLKNRLK